MKSAVPTLKSLTHILQLTDNKKTSQVMYKVNNYSSVLHITTNNKEMHHILIKYRNLFYEADSQSVFEDRFDSVLSSVLSSNDSCTSDDFSCALDS